MSHFIFIQQISVLNILNMLYISIFFSSKCRLFHNATLFGFCITHILNTGCAKIRKIIRRQKVNSVFVRHERFSGLVVPEGSVMQMEREEEQKNATWYITMADT